MIIMMSPKPTLKRGDLVLVLFPNSDWRSAKTRPALIVQADKLDTGLDQVIIAMVTSNRGRAGHPSRITILLDSPGGKQSGLLTDSVVMTDNLATVLCSAIYRVIGSYPMDDINMALKNTLGL